MGEVVVIPKEKHTKAILLLNSILNTTDNSYTEHKINDIIDLLTEVNQNKKEENGQGKESKGRD